MQVLQIINEVLRKRRERPVATIAANPYGLLMVDYLTEVCRELGTVGAISGNVQSSACPTDGSSFLTPTIPVLRDAVIRIESVVGPLNNPNIGTLKETTPQQMNTWIRQETAFGQAPQLSTHFAAVRELPVAAPTAATLALYPKPPTGLTYLINWIVNPMRIGTVVETTELSLPAHILILGVYWKVLQEVYGSDSPDVTAAYQAYQSAVSHEVAMDMQIEGSGVDAWNPV